MESIPRHKKRVKPHSTYVEPYSRKQNVPQKGLRSVPWNVPGSTCSQCGSNVDLLLWFHGNTPLTVSCQNKACYPHVETVKVG